MITAGRQERGVAAEALGHFETQHIAVEADGAFKIGHFQVNVANPDARIERLGHGALHGSVQVKQQHLRLGVRLQLQI